MIKVKILSGSDKGEVGSIAGFIVKELHKELYTYAIVILNNELQEFELERLEVINN